MELTPDTIQLLTVMAYSAMALFRRELRRYSKARADEAGFIGASPLVETLDEVDLLMEALEDRDFGSSLAVVLASEVHGAFWVQVTEGIIEKRHCDINNFGRFEVDPQLQITLKADTVLLTGSPPEVEETQGSDYVAMKTCDWALKPWLLGLDEYHGSGVPLIALSALSTMLLLRGLVTILIRFSRDYETISGNNPASEPRDRFRNQSRAASHAALYAYCVAFSRVLAKGPPIEIPAIGVFWLDRDNRRVEFRAADAFRSVIEANLEPLTMVAGKFH